MKCIAILLGLAVFAIVLVSCGGSTTSTSEIPVPISLSGNWHLMGNSTTEPLDVILLTGALTHSSNSIQGLMIAQASRCTAFLPVPVSGTYSGNSVHLSTITMGSTVNIDATLTAAGMNGTYSMSGECGGGTQGTLVGIWVPSINGNWTGRLMSDYGSPDQLITSMSLTQSAEPGTDGWYRVNGTATLDGITYRLEGELSGRLLNLYFKYGPYPDPFVTIRVHLNDTATQAGYGAKPLTGWVPEFGSDWYTAMDGGDARLDKAN